MSEIVTDGELRGEVEIAGHDTSYVSYGQGQQQMIAMAMAIEGALDEIGREVGRLAAEVNHIKARLDVQEGK